MVPAFSHVAMSARCARQRAASLAGSTLPHEYNIHEANTYRRVLVKLKGGGKGAAAKQLAVFGEHPLKACCGPDMGKWQAWLRQEGTGDFLKIVAAGPGVHEAYPVDFVGGNLSMAMFWSLSYDSVWFGQLALSRRDKIDDTGSRSSPK